MATDNDPRANAPQGAFPVDRPIDALLRDHHMVRALADKYVNTDNPEVRKQAGAQILQAIHTHSRLEESVFYPGVRNIDPGMVGHFEQEHLQADDMLATLQGMQLGDPHSDTMMRELIDMVLKHIQEEETDFFPKLQQSGMDLTPVGLQMASFEANLIHMQAQASDTSIRRR